MRGGTMSKLDNISKNTTSCVFASSAGTLQHQLLLPKVFCFELQQVASSCQAP
jgi:hypothetical protein